ncbi:AAA family ATPase [Ruminococcus sp. HUN007]|uniref:AAA family ATPase n=1 Tax=Ruminococcus sp. HUN007 TaxID=1514668 RepID=UPI0005D2C98C|nr:AAA family ATPase [Ruminococcus sp. HUN007]
MKLNIRASYDSFRELRENNSYYIDKTELIEEFLIDKFDKAVLFARPRRFGKNSDNDNAQGISGYPPG